MSLRRKIVFGALATLGVLTAAAACAALWLSHMNPSPFVKAGIEAGTPSAAADLPLAAVAARASLFRLYAS